MCDRVSDLTTPREGVKIGVIGRTNRRESEHDAIPIHLTLLLNTLHTLYFLFHLLVRQEVYTTNSMIHWSFIVRGALRGFHEYLDKFSFPIFIRY